MKYKQTKLQFEEAITSSRSLGEAADKLGIARSTFKRYAQFHGLQDLYNQYKNKGGKGISKNPKNLEDVFSGKEHLVTN
jgi:hypothetical protein